MEADRRSPSTTEIEILADYMKRRLDKDRTTIFPKTSQIALA